MSVGDETADPGPALILDSESTARLSAVATSWEQLADAHCLRRDDARLALADYERTVQPAMDDERSASNDAAGAKERVAAATRDLDNAAAEAYSAAAELLNEVAEWPTAPEGLYTSDDDSVWHGSDIGEVMAAEPGQVLAAVLEWRTASTERALRAVAALSNGRQECIDRAEELESKAGKLRQQALDLRSGQLLPLPRPVWLTVSDDSTAIAAALEWSPQISDPHERALLETALAASGLLSATLAPTGASAGPWQVRPVGPACPGETLADVLAADSNHALASVASAILQRCQQLGKCDPQTNRHR